MGRTVGLVAMAGAAYAFVGRPWLQKWGATVPELGLALPGDDLVTNPLLESTRAISIQAPAEAVWPWLVQIGYRRGGWYSYDFLEAAIGVADFVDGHSTDRIVPELQNLAVGDIICTDPGGGFTVVELEPNRHMVLRARIDGTSGQHITSFDEPVQGAVWDTSWAFVLRPLGAHLCRLLIRFRADSARLPANYLFGYGALEPAVFLMERKMLLGIKARAETR